MRRVSGVSVVAALLMAEAAVPQGWVQAVRLRVIDGEPAGGIARAVVVEEGALVHTALMFPEDADGSLAGRGDARAQTTRVLANVERALEEAGTTLGGLARLHVYVADVSVTPHVEAQLADRFGGRKRKPAVTFVQTLMPRAGVLVAMDAIAATGPAGEPGTPVRRAVATLPQRTRRASHLAIQPAGPFVVVSGRAARGEFESAIRETLGQLRADLAAAGLTFEHVVQIKSFLGDMGRAQRLEELVADAFGGDRVPPQVVTGWDQEAIAAEIELIATAPRTDGRGARVEHVEPIGGRYARVVRVNTGSPIFISGLYGQSADPASQVVEMFEELKTLLREAGSDVHHLAKATYYVSDPRADERINAIRPTVYPAEGPPAASKLAVRGTGRPGKGSTFDMLAVTEGP